jgi:hypothetical protein
MNEQEKKPAADDTVAELRGTIWRLEDDLTGEREENARLRDMLLRAYASRDSVSEELNEARDTIDAWIKQAGQPGGRVKRPATPSVDVGAMWDD